ncbi:MAG: type II toxin-antitoxin system Phd/YefM family antitoxin [Xanthomonadaceae bacterium]|nr:type II toxin-antitoxin system Phd/YefM family antitoxin [Xanthomonadaceae bacterium]
MKVNALKIRQSFGKILEMLNKKNEPIVIEKGREPVAVLISIEDYKSRFIDRAEQEKRNELLALAQKITKEPVQGIANSLELLRELRYGRRS